jgi:hypothetical protein
LVPGYEWLFAPHWTVRGEYLFYDLGKSDNNVLTFPDHAVRIRTHSGQPLQYPRHDRQELRQRRSMLELPLLTRRDSRIPEPAPLSQPRCIFQGLKVRRRASLHRGICYCSQLILRSQASSVRDWCPLWEDHLFHAAVNSRGVNGYRGWIRSNRLICRLSRICRSTSG